MAMSMTGFGRKTVQTENFSITVEIKTVNHRFREYYIRMPRQLNEIENKLKNIINKEVSRGRVEVFITMSGEGLLNRQVMVDWPLLDDYFTKIKKIKKEFTLKDDVSLEHLLSLDELINVEELEMENESLFTSLLKAVESAVIDLKEMRSIEGAALKETIIDFISKIKYYLNKLVDLAPQIVTVYEERLMKKLTELLDDKLDETRLLTEVALFADKVDISEELTRLESHLSQLEKTLNLSEPIGRKLDFLLQEINREVNTIGSKANDSEIGIIVVEMKSLFEKIKEQVQNIE